MSELLEREKQLRAAGFPEVEVERWRNDQVNQLRAAGFAPQEINRALGIPPEPDMAAVKQHFQESIKGTEEKPVEGVVDALKAGWGMSVSSLAVDRPTGATLTADSDMAERIAYSIGQITGDLPFMILGGVIGGGAGTPTGPGAIVTAGAGALALPFGLRATLMDAYEKGDFNSPGEFVSRSMGIFWETIKGGIVGGATAGAGRAATALLPKGASTSAQIVIPTAAELATMVTVGRALEGELPHATDFIDGAILLGGFKGATHFAKSLRESYKQGVLKPEEVIGAARTDVTVLQDLADVRTRVPRALESVAKERGGKLEPRSTEQAKDISEAMSIVARDATELSTEVRPAEGKKGQTYEHGDPGTARKSEMDPAKAEKEIAGQMVKRPEPQAEKLTWDHIYTEVKDKLHPIKKIVDVINHQLGRKLQPDRDPYVLMRLLAGNSGKFKQVVELNVYDSQTLANLGPGLEPRLAPVKGQIDEFQTYVLAKRSLERTKKGFETGISKEAAEAVVKKFEETEGGVHLGGERSTFAKTFQSIVEFQEIVGREFLVKTGIMSERQFLEILEHSKDFVPLHRVFEEMQVGRSEAFVWNPIKEFKGSNAKIIRPLESILRNTYLYIALGEKNRAANALLEGVEAVNRFRAGREGPPLPPKPGVTTVGDEFIPVFKELPGPAGGKIVLKGGPNEPPLIEQIPNTKDLPAPLREVGRRYSQETAETLKPLFEAMSLGQGDQITVFRNGERITLKVAPEVAEVFHGLDAQSMGALLRMFSLPAQMLRAGVVQTPEYSVRNILVDQPMAGILSKHGYIPFLSALRSITHVWSKDAIYQRWLKSGGANVALVNVDSRYVESKFIQWGSETGWYKRVWNNVELNYKEGGALKGTAATVGDAAYALFAPLRIFSQMTDTLTRLGEMRLADREGTRRSAIRAGFDTREVTQDFLRMGSKMKAFNAITAFANAQLEGVDRLVRGFKDRPGATMFKISGMIMLPTLMLWLANRDEEWYKDQPDFIKDNYWLFEAGGHIYKIRKPFEVGTIFASGLERALEAMFNDDEEAFKGFANSVFKNIIPNALPTVATPVIENITDHSFFNDRPLIPRSLEHVLPEYQYTPYTSEVAKAIGNVVGFVPNLKSGKLGHPSPIVVDNYIRQWTGGMGQYALQVADKALIAAKIVPDPIKPAAELEDLPVIKAFMVRWPSANTKSIQYFYDNFNTAEKRINTVKLLAQRGDADAALRIASIEEEMIKIQGIRTALGNANRLAQTIIHLKDIDPQEKRQLLEATYFGMTEMGRAGAEAIRIINKELKPRSEQ